MLQIITDQLKDNDEQTKITNDWKFAAMVIDRMCLIIFTLFTIIATITVLFSAPHIIVTWFRKKQARHNVETLSIAIIAYHNHLHNLHNHRHYHHHRIYYDTTIGCYGWLLLSHLCYNRTIIFNACKIETQ